MTPPINLVAVLLTVFLRRYFGISLTPQAQNTVMSTQGLISLGGLQWPVGLFTACAITYLVLKKRSSTITSRLEQSYSALANSSSGREGNRSPMNFLRYVRSILTSSSSLNIIAGADSMIPSMVQITDIYNFDRNYGAGPSTSGARQSLVVTSVYQKNPNCSASKREVSSEMRSRKRSRSSATEDSSTSLSSLESDAVAVERRLLKKTRSGKVYGVWDCSLNKRARTDSLHRSESKEEDSNDLRSNEEK